MHPRRFTVPAPDKVINPSVDTDPSSVRAWMGELPYADLTSATREVRAALALLNRHPQRLSTRTELMALFRTPCARLVRVTPDQPKGVSSEELRQLMTEMAYGYKHLVNDAMNQRSWLQHRKRLLQAIYFATKYLSLELFLAFESYDCKTANSWREILALYRLAEQQNLHHEPAEDRDQPEPGNATVSHLLKRILLLKLLDPCRMMQEEARVCFDYFNIWASAAVVEQISETTNLAGRFLLDLDGLDPPRAPDPDTLPQNAERFRYFNLLPVSKQVHHHLRQMELKDADPPEGLQRLRNLGATQVLKRMLQTWHGRQERRNERDESFGWMLCGNGLGAVNHFLSTEMLPSCSPSAVGGSPDPETATEENVDLETLPGLARPSARYSRRRCRQVNRSIGGVCLRLQMASEADPRVGQLLLLQDDLPDGRGDWHAGIVRRRLRIDATTLEVGIQFIRGIIRPISVRLRTGNGDTHHYQPALWVDRGDSPLSSILVGRGLYVRGRELIVEGGEPAPMIQAEQLIESTPSFERFRFRVSDA